MPLSLVEFKSWWDSSQIWRFFLSFAHFEMHSARQQQQQTTDDDATTTTTTTNAKLIQWRWIMSGYIILFLIFFLHSRSLSPFAPFHSVLRWFASSFTPFYSFNFSGWVQQENHATRKPKLFLSISLQPFCSMQPDRSSSSSSSNCFQQLHSLFFDLHDKR